MTVFTKAGQQIFAPVDENGNARSPVLQEAQVWTTEVEALIKAFVSSGGLIYSSKEALDADLAHDANSMAWVLGDATAANNGIYRKIGASAGGSWTRAGDLPYSFIIASDAGAGTPNAIVATTAIPVSESALILLNIADTNTQPLVTVSFNGGSALTVKTNSGENIATGGLVSGMVVMGVVSGATFRLVSDQASSAIIAAAEAAAAAALAAANAGFVFDTDADFEAATIPDVLDFVEVASDEALTKGGGVRWAKLPGLPVPVYDYHKMVDGKWFEPVEPSGRSVSVKAFGARLSGSQTPALRRAKIQAAIDWAAPRGYTVFFPAGEWVIDRALTFHSGNRIAGAGMMLAKVKLADTADADENVVEPSAFDGSVSGWHLDNLWLDGNCYRQGTIAMGEARPGGSCLSTAGSKWGFINNVYASDAVLHCFDICNGGEMNGGVLSYVSSANLSPTYWPANQSEFIFIRNSRAKNPGDDAFTVHYSRYWSIIDCVAENGSTRHSSTPPGRGTSTAFEVDDGASYGFLSNIYARDFLTGLAIKAHGDNPAPFNINVDGAIIEECEKGVLQTNPNASDPLAGRGINGNNIIVRRPGNSYSNVEGLGGFEFNRLNGGSWTNLQAIARGTETGVVWANGILIGNNSKNSHVQGFVENWAYDNTTDSTVGAVRLTSSVDGAVVDVVARNTGYRGLTDTGSTRLTLRGSYKNDTVLSGSQGLRLSSHPRDSGSNVSALVSGFETLTSFNTINQTANTETYTPGIVGGKRLNIGAPTTTDRSQVLHDEVTTAGSEVFRLGGANVSVTIHERGTSGSGTGNAANAVLKVASMTTTGRSINAGGTINASGADYAEYHEVKDYLWGVVSAGSILGFAADGLLTNVYADVVGRFVIKSTRPYGVGGDDWGSEKKLIAKYGIEPLGVEDSEGFVERRAAMMVAYESERAKWDRIAKSGYVPVNIKASAADIGKYLVPAAQAQNASAELVAEADLTLIQYVRSIGTVIGVADDGRPLVEVKVG